MGLFGKKEPEPVATRAPPPAANNHGTGLFGSRKSNSMDHPRRSHDVAHSPTGTNGRPKKGLLSRRRSSLSSSDEERRSSGGLFSRKEKEDPSISNARQRVSAAEQAERDAEQALIHARESVQDAKQHVRNLEIEAKEDARRAKIKSAQAKEIGKAGSKLGRF